MLTLIALVLNSATAKAGLRQPLPNKGYNQPYAGNDSDEYKTNQNL